MWSWYILGMWSIMQLMGKRSRGLNVTAIRKNDDEAVSSSGHEIAAPF